MKRVAILGVITLMFLIPAADVLAAGGGAPPTFAVKIDKRPAITATILIDPHMAAGDPGFNFFGPIALPADITPPTSKQVSAFLQGGNQNQISTSVSFKIVPNFTLYRGCDPTLTNTRFLFSASNPANLTDWVQAFAMQALFLPFGVTPTSTLIPAITKITSAQCISDPAHPSVISDGGDGLSSQPGWLLMNVTIQFLSPAP
ncbi:MAG: hypothetical protein HY216_07325 [Candidatus Rokubacteria bacterium]|nr:hypothetical protein [Candidatus Rokubacteria bacterium]